MSRDTDSDWEIWGENDPYFGVCTMDQFRLGRMTNESRAEFFRTGEGDVRRWIDYCRRHIDPDFEPKRALDFGCGVGRLLIATARIAEEVTGIDVSESMLEEARKNCEEFSLNNVTLLKSDDRLSLLKGEFDFVYSHIVIQHIPPERGTVIIERLVDHLASGGIGYLQMTYAHEECRETLGVPPPSMRHGFKEQPKLIKGAKRLVKKLIGRPDLSLREPPMQMNVYNLNQVMYILQQKGVTDLHVTFTNHSGIFGAALYFRRP
ncbi:MAG TPA: class I SAM-dependent methyltransferase [Fimbriimonadaceae bacterium]|nr:class I SAM-dependent methyltransferase [Fimbriimonadaceae bacterium]